MRTATLVPATLVLVEPILDERTEFSGGFLGVGAAYFDFEPSAALGTQRRIRSRMLFPLATRPSQET